MGTKNDLIRKQDIIRLINELPNTAPQKGEWIDKANGIKLCNRCDGAAKEKTNFCPNCGADMRGEE